MNSSSGAGSSKSRASSSSALLFSKQAIVYILDSSPTMNEPYPSTTIQHSSEDCRPSTSRSSSDDEPTSYSRFDVAKEILVGSIADLMLESKTNLCGVIVLHTMESGHHLLSRMPKEEEIKGLDPTKCPRGVRDDADLVDSPHQQHADYGDYRHITELSPVERPTVELLRQIDGLSCSARAACTNSDSNGDTSHADNHNNNTEDPSKDVIPPRLGGFCHGITVAASALYRRTFGKRFSRKIILITDAEREVEMRWEELDDTVAGMREMNCSLTVIGLDFKRSAVFDVPADIVVAAKDECTDHSCVDAHPFSDVVAEMRRNENQSIQGNVGQVTMAPEDDTVAVETVKDENEMFLISLIKYTGGEIHAACTIQHLLEKARARKIPKSTLNKIEFQIAPGLTVNARISLYSTPQSLPTLKREAVTLDRNGTIQKNALGEVMSIPIVNITSHWDADEPDVEVDLEHRAQGYPYGSDLIPIAPIEMEGLKMRSDPRITILGYASMECIPMSVWMGPTRIVTGERGCSRSCLAISAIAQALLNLNQLAICTFVKQKDSDPDIGILIPVVGTSNNKSPDGKSSNIPDGEKPRHLLYVRIPFADDIQNITMHPFRDAVKKEAVNVCDDFVDAFTFPPHVLNSVLLPNPVIRSFRNMMIGRALNRGQVEFGKISHFDDQPFTGKERILEQDESLKRFRATFPLEIQKWNSKERQKKRYFLSDSQY